MNQINQVSENIEDFLKALATALLTWQGVEYNLFLIFNFLVGPPPTNPAVLSSVYHSVVNINTRREMVDAAAAVVLKDKPYLKEWEELSNKIRKEAIKRNYLAHFGLALHTDTKGETKALLKPSIFDVRDKNKDREYDINQIIEWNKLFISLVADLSDFLNKSSNWLGA
jgi:hypothetical protein